MCSAKGKLKNGAVKIMRRQLFAGRDRLAQTPYSAHQALQAERAGQQQVRAHVGEVRHSA